MDTDALERRIRELEARLNRYTLNGLDALLTRNLSYHAEPYVSVVPTEADKNGSPRLVRNGANDYTLYYRTEDGWKSVGSSTTTVPDPSATVTAETTYGASSAAGTSDDYSRGDHTHGTPALPSPSDIGAADTSHAATHADGGSDEVAVEGLPTASTTTTHVLMPDGTGGVEFVALADGDIPSTIARDSEVPSNATFNDHSARHENGGADEISIAGLSGTSAELALHEADTSNPHSVTAAQVGAPSAEAGAGSIWVQSSEPTASATGDIWIDTSA